MKFTKEELIHAQLVSRNEVFQRNLDQQIAAETDPKKKEVLRTEKELLIAGENLLEGRTDVLDNPDLDAKIELVATAENMNTRSRWENFFTKISSSMISDINDTITPQQVGVLREQAINRLGDRVLTDPNNIVEAFNDLGFTAEFFQQKAASLESDIEQHRQQFAHAEKNRLLDREGREQAAQKLAFEEDRLKALRALSSAFQPDGIFVQTWRNMDNGVTAPEDAVAMIGSLNKGEPIELLENTLKTYVHERFGLSQQDLADNIEERKKVYIKLYKKNPTGNILLGLLMAAMLEVVQGTTDVMGVPLR